MPNTFALPIEGWTQYFHVVSGCLNKTCVSLDSIAAPYFTMQKQKNTPGLHLHIWLLSKKTGQVCFQFLPLYVFLENCSCMTLALLASKRVGLTPENHSTWLLSKLVTVTQAVLLIIYKVSMSYSNTIYRICVTHVVK